MASGLAKAPRPPNYLQVRSKLVSAGRAEDGRRAGRTRIRFTTEHAGTAGRLTIASELLPPARSATGRFPVPLLGLLLTRPARLAVGGVGRPVVAFAGLGLGGFEGGAQTDPAGRRGCVGLFAVGIVAPASIVVVFFLPVQSIRVQMVVAVMMVMRAVRMVVVVVFGRWVGVVSLAGGTVRSTVHVAVGRPAELGVCRLRRHA